MNESDVIGWLLMNDLVSRRNQALFGAIAALALEGKPVDVVTTIERCKAHGTWGKDGLTDEYVLGLVSDL